MKAKSVLRSKRALILAMVALLGAGVVWDLYAFGAQNGAAQQSSRALAEQTAQARLLFGAIATGTAVARQITGLDSARQDAAKLRAIARAQILTLRAHEQLAADPELSILLAMEAMSTTV